MQAFSELRDDRGARHDVITARPRQLDAGRFADAAARWTEASLHARQAGDQREELEAMSWVPLMVCAGPTPSDEALQRCHEVLLRADGDKKTMARVRSWHKQCWKPVWAALIRRVAP